MKKISSVSKVICDKKDSVFNYFGWPTVARLQDGTLAMVASGFRMAHVCPFGKTILCYSRNDGDTWSEPTVVIDTPLDDRDGGIAVYGEKNVMITSFNNKVESQRWYADSHHDEKRAKLSNSYLDMLDAEAVEEKYLGSLYRISQDGGYTFGPIQNIGITAPHGPCTMLDNRLMYIGQPFRTFHQEEGQFAPLECHIQNEAGMFEYRSSIENIRDEYGLFISCEPHAIMLPSGKIIVHIRVERSGDYGKETGFNLYQCESYDEGRSFTKPHLIGLTSGAPSHLMRHSSGVLVASYGYRKEPFGQRVMLSYDDGQTWDTDYIIRDDGPSLDLGYPSTVERKDGSLLTVYYQQKPEQKNCVIMQSIWHLPAHAV